MKSKGIGITVILGVYIICYQIIWGANMPQIQSEGAILIEAKTNTILYSKNADKRFYPASITKILTAFICEEMLSNQAVITKTKDAVKQVPSDSSHIGLQIGDSFLKEEALYGLLLGSDNFIAYDLAVKQAGSIDSFVKGMNKQAKKLGAINTQFTNPHGYHDEAHYTTPYDMAQIAKGVFSNQKITEIAGTKSYPFKVNNKQRTLGIKNTSKLIDPTSPYYNPYVIASKTGWHDDAGQTLVAKATYSGMELIAVTMNTKSPNQYKDINTLFEYGSKHFKMQQVDGKEQLQNNTYSSFGDAFVKYGREQGWRLAAGKNYQEPINYSEFIDILGFIWGRENVKKTLSDYRFEDPSSNITRKETAYLLHKVMQGLGIQMKLPEINPYITDIDKLHEKYQKAICYTVGTKLLGANNQPFNPEAKISYEEMLCVVYRIQSMGIK